MTSCHTSSSLKSMLPSSVRSWQRCEIQLRIPSGPTYVKDPSGGGAASETPPLSGRTDLACCMTLDRACRKHRQQDYIHVGMTAALTGRYSLPGRQAWLGAQTWVEDTNRAGGIWLHGSRTQLPLRLTSYDDASEPEQCTALTERLITADQVDISAWPVLQWPGAQSC